MPECSLTDVHLRGVAAAVPEAILGVDDLIARFGEDKAEKLVASTGVRERRLVRPGQTTGDLCEVAARALLRDLDWDPKSVDAMLMVSQTHDHIAPATSCILHGRLGLGKHAAVFDIGLGCSGWVYGLWIASTFLRSGLKRVLVLSGDTTSTVSPYDNYGALASDAGTATALEAAPGSAMSFSLGTDGSGWQALWVPAGGFRKRSGPDAREYHVCEDGVLRNDEHTHMNGPEIFTFTIREVPPLIDRVLTAADWARDDIDSFVLHQANKYMLDYLVKRMKIPVAKVPFSIEKFGNTSSASIPLTIQQCLRERLSGGSAKLLMAGFGVGLSWGALAAEVGPLVIPELQYLP